MAHRTTLILDEASQAKLKELSTLHGTQSAAIRDALDKAHARLIRNQKRAAFIEELITEAGEPTSEDRAWAREVAASAAAAKVRASTSDS